MSDTEERTCRGVWWIEKIDGEPVLRESMQHHGCPVDHMAEYLGSKEEA